MGTMSRQIFLPLLILVLFSHDVSGQTEGDVRLKDGPNAYEGRPEIFHDGVWLSLCYSFSNYYVPGTICKQLGYQSQAAVSYVSSSYGKAPGEIFGQYISCTSSSASVSQCSMTDRQDNCDPRYTLGVSCNTTNSATKIRLKGGSTQYEGRIEIFENGVWGTVCRNYHRYTTYIHRDINAHIACRELFGSGYGGTYYPTHETPDRFGILQSGAIQRRHVQCKGNEDSIFDCSFSRGGHDAACYHEMDATVKCFPVPDGCVGYYMSVTGSLTSPGYPAGHNFTEDTVCAWFIQTASGRTLNMSFPDIDAHNQSDSSSYLQVSDRTYYYWRTSYGSLLPNLVSATSYAFIRQTNKAGTFGIDFAASWTPTSCDYSSNNLWTTQYTLRSPGYSGVYPTGLDCFYLYRFRKQLSVVVTFYAFHLDDESNGVCQDYLEIFDGHTGSNHTVGRFCNSTRPPTLTMSQHNVLFHFHSDDTIDSTSQGFYVRVSGVEPVPVEQNLNASSGLVTSPGYPALYANETDYKWNIVLLPYQSVTLNVSHYKSSVCSGYERLLVYYTDHRGSSTYTYLYCGRTGAVVVSYSNRMQLWLQAVSEVSNGQAFQAMWKTECRRSFSGASGTIMSPDSPNAYPTNLDCSYLITRDTGYYINLTFTSFALDSDLCNDYVQIFDGSSNSFPLLTSPLCGSSLPPVLLSTSNSLWIEFHSDGTTDPSSTGFVATYTSHIKECKSTTLTSINGFLASPGYPVQYAQFTYCVWTITVPFGIVELTFQDFAVGQKSTYDCYGAQVRVYDGENVDASTVIETLCGAVAVPKIISTGRSLTVVLNSYGSSPTSAIGFQASYKSISSKYNSEFNQELLE
ncbi:cubilin-like [Littorina saxatilis]